MSETRHKPRITVITPSLNQGAYIRQCIESVVGQGYPDLEYFIFDGGSTDDTLAVIREYESSINHWVSEPDAGQSDAINKGLRRATGDLVAWLNADDYYLPGALDRVAEAHRENPTAPFYFGDGIRIDAAGTDLGRFCPADRLIFDRDALLMGLNYILQPSTFINRNALAGSVHLDAKLRYGMDSDLWMRLSGAGEPQPIQALLAATREHAATKTASGLFERIEELREISRRHSSLHMTPGVLCYFLDTLNRYARERPDAFPPAFLADLAVFWEKSAGLLEKYRAGADGFPRDRAAERAREDGTLLATRPMKIGIDLRQLIPGASGGISQLVKGVLESLFVQFPQHQYLVFCTPFNRGMLDYDASHVRFFSLPALTFFTDVDRIAREESMDVLFRAYPMEDTLGFPMDRQVVLIPDIQHETHPEFFSGAVLDARRAAFARALGQAGAIGTISEFSRKTLREFPQTRCGDIFLMPPSLQFPDGNAIESELSDAERALVPQEDYLLFPANLWKHKNHVRVLQAFKLLVQKSGRNVCMVLTGHPDGWSELAGQFPGLPVRHLGFVRPALLRTLYSRARALVFFSLYEGFGIPLLEAFDAGTPVICSNTTSLAEVGGDAVLACDPANVEAMAALMERILSDNGLRGELIERGRSRLKRYSWESSARGLMQALVRVARLPELSEARQVPLAGPLPLVSIVTPSFNQGRFLKRTIDSVLGQTYPHIEFVVVDGGSSDESVEILRSYGDRLTWVSEPDRGQTHAINKGMAMVRGEILAYLNSDDVLLPDAVASAVRFFRENPACDMVYGNADYIDESDQVTGTYRTAEYSFRRLLEDCMVCQPAAFWRRKIADAVGPFNEELHYAMDYDYWQRIACAGGDIRFFPVKLACSRRYPETKTLSARAEIHREIFRICRDNAGIVHQNFFIGYWHHLVFERDGVFARILRKSPESVMRIAWLHHKWYNRQRYTRQDVMKFLYGWTKHRVLKAGRWVAGAFGTRARAPSNGMLVTGYMTDNWLGPVVTVPPRASAKGQVLHMAGVTPINNVMTVKAGEIVIGTFSLPANEYRKVTLDADLVDGAPITIGFSDYFVDTAHRRLSFLLQDTNLFTEQESR